MKCLHAVLAAFQLAKKSFEDFFDKLRKTDLPTVGGSVFH